MDASIFSTPKIDCHCHLFDPESFPYTPGVFYSPSGGEIATAAYFTEVMDAYGVSHALLVGPNSGYGTDNRCMLDAIRNGKGRFKGIAVVDNDASTARLQDLQAQGVVGIAFNMALLGLAHYADADALWERIAALGMCVQVQVEGDQMAALAPRLMGCGAQILVDHHGRPDLSPLHQGLASAGFQALLGMAASGRCTVKLSGYDKFSREALPFADARPFTAALLEAFDPTHCIWGSDWPHVRATRRLDYGPLLNVLVRSVPSEADRRAILLETPARLFGFEMPGQVSDS
ncbi:2-pyrone-4,6-dicarboxylate hydrolase [Variovorax sp. WS11]|uniref:amidohydrolase family protein n=1 Tax=Variovorax sp. WS11 TaxID=1105204 RepID=UPI000D0CC006|nr:amidohydrolase family protein [Variovorax sp. WS11]NDZ16571.1 amidohydrolase family protein [Variovorax sp. WS11]PSL85857.1 2-pyrone-4,6-dicarboxylate hydrolase [Variovorax sp. WS11]